MKRDTYLLILGNIKTNSLITSPKYQTKYIFFQFQLILR